MLPLPISEKIDCPNHGGDACTLQILLPKTHGRTTPRPTKLEQIPRVLKSPGTGRTSAYRLFSKRFMHWQGVTGEAPVTQTLPREECVLNGGRGARPRPQRTLRYTGAVPRLRPRHMECLQAQECGACRMRDAAKRANSVLHAAPDGEERAPAALQGRPLRCPVVPASPSPATGSVE